MSKSNSKSTKSSKSKKDTKTTVKAVQRKDRELRVRKNPEGYKSRIVQFNDIDRIVFRVDNVSKKESSRANDKGEKFNYLSITVSGKLEDEDDKEFRPIVFKLPSGMVSPSGIMTKYGAALSCELRTSNQTHKGYIDKILTMRSRLAEALAEKYDDISVICKLTKTDNINKRKKKIGEKLSKLVGPPEKYPDSDLWYFIMDCPPWIPLSIPEVSKGNYTRNVERVNHDDLMDVKVTHSSKCTIEQLNCMSSAIGVKAKVVEGLITNIEPLTEEVDVGEELDELIESGQVMDISAKLKEIKEAAKANDNDEELLKSMTKDGTISLGELNEGDGDGSEAESESTEEENSE